MLMWIAILLLVDSGIALLFERRISGNLPRINIKKLALIEAAIGLVLAAVAIWMRRR